MGCSTNFLLVEPARSLTWQAVEITQPFVLPPRNRRADAVVSTTALEPLPTVQILAILGRFIHPVAFSYLYSDECRLLARNGHPSPPAGCPLSGCRLNRSTQHRR